MKQVYLIGFRGVGIHPQYQQEHGLILLGHVGLAFEDNPKQIVGFHPTKAALATFDSPQSALKWLRERKTLDGALQDDSTIFRRAAVLSQENPRLTVWECPIALTEERYNKVKSQTLA
jgi:hypothetical protein